VLANVIERIGAAMPASWSLESKMLGAPFAPSTAGQIARLISSIRPAGHTADEPAATRPTSFAINGHRVYTHSHAAEEFMQ
jgi:hypothetical protein